MYLYVCSLHMCICVNMSMYIRMFVFVWAYMGMCVCMGMCVYVSACMWVYVCVCMGTYVCMYVCVHMYACVCVYRHANKIGQLKLSEKRKKGQWISLHCLSQWDLTWKPLVVISVASEHLQKAVYIFIFLNVIFSYNLLRWNSLNLMCAQTCEFSCMYTYMFVLCGVTWVCVCAHIFHSTNW